MEDGVKATRRADWEDAFRRRMVAKTYANSPQSQNSTLAPPTAPSQPSTCKKKRESDDKTNTDRILSNECGTGIEDGDQLEQLVHTVKMCRQ